MQQAMHGVLIGAAVLANPGFDARAGMLDGPAPDAPALAQALPLFEEKVVPDASALIISPGALPDAIFTPGAQASSDVPRLKGQPALMSERLAILPALKVDDRVLFDPALSDARFMQLELRDKLDLAPSIAPKRPGLIDMIFVIPSPGTSATVTLGWAMTLRRRR